MARYLGIEATDAKLKCALLRTAYKKVVLEGVYTVFRNPGPEGLAAAARELAAMVTQHLTAAQPGVRAGELDGVYAALPGTDVSLRLVSLPRAVHKRGDKGLRAELEDNVPFDVDECIVDAQILANKDPVELLAAAAREDRVRAFIDALKGSGLEPREVGVGPLCLAELAAEIPELAQPGAAMVVYATESHAEVVVLVDGVARFARALHGLTTPAARTRAVRQTVAAWLGLGGAAPTVAFLVGDEAQAMAAPCMEGANLTAERVLPLPNGAIEFGPGASPQSLWEAPVAVALAARGIGRGARMDLRKGALAMGGNGEVFRERAPQMLGAAAAVVLFWGIATWARYQGLVTERDRLQETLLRVTREAFNESVEDPVRAMSMARGTGGVEEVDPMPAADAFDVMGVLSTRISTAVRHDIELLDINREHVQLQGIVDSLQDRDRVVEALGQWPCFPGVRPGRAQTNPGDNRQKYTLDIEFRCPGSERNTRRGEGDRGNNPGGTTAPRQGS
jgi:hypothetical protein